MPLFFIGDEHAWQDLGGGVERKVLSWSDELMAVAVRFVKGGVGAPHAHDGHTQIGYIASGSFDVIVGAEKRVLKAGDSYLAEKNVLHGVVALEDGSVLIDVFTPKRADFLPTK